MCGRFTLRTPTPVLAKVFRCELDLFAPRYNIAPTQNIPVVRMINERRKSTEMHWGLIPPWSKDPADAARRINCRSETAAEKPSFRAAFQKRRCLVIADGYYEWERRGKQKLPWFIHRTDNAPFAMAGLWESWRPAPGADPILSCTVLTTQSNQCTADLHDRMPVILEPEDENSWLDKDLAESDRLEQLFQPFPSEHISIRPVSTFVNNARHEGEGCLGPRPTQGELF